ncbi:hypothetical protein [Nonomuraea sp. WAC 01424]|uniref:hypothetical protein n=1 Tax=Nonomuraea sp. WAC 01424 TaxID=2203200 RepID=UPI000F78506A|nr:hypothetical protein [Nonomuraea sp. WAC 01424]
MTITVAVSLYSTTSTAGQFCYEQPNPAKLRIRGRRRTRRGRVHPGNPAILEGPWSAITSNAPAVALMQSTLLHYEDDGTDEHVRAQVSRLWAEDWDSPEDALYDEL